MSLGKTRRPAGDGLEKRCQKIPEVFGVTRPVPMLRHVPPSIPVPANGEMRSACSSSASALARSRHAQEAALAARIPAAFPAGILSPAKWVLGASTALALPAPCPQHAPARAPTGSISGKGGGGKRAGPLRSPWDLFPGMN